VERPKRRREGRRQRRERERERERPQPPGRALLQPHAHTPSKASHSPTHHVWEPVNLRPAAHRAERAREGTRSVPRAGPGEGGMEERE
jgi:hypothetical protein